MGVEYRKNSVTLGWLLTACDVVMAVVGMSIAYVLFQKVSPIRNIRTDDIKWYFSFTVILCVVVSLYLSPLASRTKARADEIMQRCFRKGVLMFVLLCAALTFVRGVAIAHCFLAVYSLFFMLLLLLEEFLSRYIISKVWQRNGDIDNGEWDVVVLPVCEEPLQRIDVRFEKRLFDVCVSLSFLLTLFPIVYVVMFFVTKARKCGSVLTTLRCCGMDGRMFSCVVFRCGSGGVRKMPLALNVLIGDMSVVGSLMCASSCSEQYNRLLEQSMVHHRIKSGITSWDRVKDSGSTEESVEYGVKNDIWYVENWSLWLDVCIVLKTLVTRGKGNVCLS